MDKDWISWLGMLIIAGSLYLLKRIRQKDPFEGQLPDENSEAVKELRKALAEKMAKHREVTNSRVPASFPEVKSFDNVVSIETRLPVSMPQEATSVRNPSAFASLLHPPKLSSASTAGKSPLHNRACPSLIPSPIQIKKAVLWSELLALPLALRTPPRGRR